VIPRSKGGRAKAAASVLALGFAVALAACGGSSGSSSTPAGPRPSPSATPLVASVDVAAHGLMQLALAATATDRYYARLVRPGVGPLLGVLPPSATPTCDPSSATASEQLPNENGTQTTATIVTYPAGDTTCSKSPLRVLVIAYATTGASPLLGVGYEASWASATDPIVPPGSVSAVEDIETAVYSAGNIDTRIQQFGTQTIGSQPPPGAFPATFPTGLPVPALPAPFAPSYYIASVASGSSSRAGTGADYDGYIAVNGSDATIGTLDAPSLSAVVAGGSTTLSWSTSAPLYAVDTGSALGAQIVVPPNTFPLASGATAWSLSGFSPLAVESSPLNFPHPVTGSAAYASDGNVTACRHDYVDAVNQVGVQVTCNGNGTIAMTVTDLLAHKPLTTPSPVVMDADGTSNSFTFNFDQTTEIIGTFALSFSG
jgi:hypothetical protein